MANYKNVVEEQKRLADQVKDYQKQQAQSAFDQGQRSLNEQIRLNREGMQQSRNTLSEQSYLAQRQNQQGATSRGLGSSGMRDASALQNQIQQGRATNELEQANASVNREAMSTRLGLSEQLANAMSGAEAQSAEMQLDADKFGLDQAARESELLIRFTEMAKEGMPIGELEAFLNLAGFDLNDVVGSEDENGEGKTLGEILGQVGGGDVGVFGDTNIDNINSGGAHINTDLYEKVEGSLLSGDGLQLRNKQTGEILKYRGDSLYGSRDEYIGDDGTIYKKYKLGGNLEYYSQDQARAKVNEIFKGKKYIGTGANDIQIRDQKNGYGLGFWYKGKMYKTYNAAVKKVVAQEAKNQKATTGKKK